MGFHTLSIGKTALLTSQYAMNITGNNIANAASDGYSRQLVSTQAITPQGWGYGASGLGVEMASVRRVNDNFLETQMRNAYSRGEFLGAMNTCYYNLEAYFNEGTTSDISSALDNFFDSVADWNDHVEDASTRTQVIEIGESLAGRFNVLGKQLSTYRENINYEVVGMVDELNTLSTEIARLNQAIVQMECGGKTGVVANDLRDQRDIALKNLAGLVDIVATEEPNGSVIVRNGSRNLVYYNIVHEVTTKQMKSDDQFVDIPVWADDGSPMQISDGKLGAMLDIRDEVVYGFKTDVDKLAATVIWEVDRVHSQSAGMVPLSSVTSTRAPYSTNANLDELPYSFNYPSDVFKIQNGTVDIIVYDKAKDIEKTVTVEIDLDRRANPNGERDTILWDPEHPDAENSLVNIVQKALDAQQPGVFEVGVDSLNHFYINCTSESFGFGFGTDTSGVLAALGLNTFFSGHNAATMSVNPALQENNMLLAGAQATTESKAYVDGNNHGSQALLNLRNASLFNAGSTTIDGYYQTITGRLGVEGARIQSDAEAQANILLRVTNTREELCGVSLDEELTKLIQYQRSFQSASKFISITDQLYETLINM